MTGAILAGGKSSRFGENKALFRIQGRPMIEWVLESIKSVTEESFIISNKKESYLYLGIPVHGDIFPGLGPLAGLHSALFHATYDQVLLVACDMPFLPRDFLRRLTLLAKGNKTIIPYGPKGPEPLVAVYHKDILPEVELRLKTGKLSMKDLVASIPHEKMKIDKLKTDANSEHLININTKDDLSEALKRSNSH